MSFATNIVSGFVRVGTEFKAVRTLISGSSTGDITGLTTTDKSSLVAAINEVKVGATGGATSLDGLSDVAITSATAGDVLRNDGSGQFVNVAGSTYFQPRDAELDALSGAVLTDYGIGLLSLANATALTAAVNDATSTTAGKVRYATSAEASLGLATDRALTPAAGAAAYQPLDSDLTSIAAATTAPYGIGLLALANQAALTAALANGTTALAGTLLLADSATTVTGTDTAKATTSAGTKAAIDARIINDSSLSSNSTTDAPSVASAKAYADNLLEANNSLRFKGAIDASTNPNFPAADAGHQYRISVAGKIGGGSGYAVEVNDTLYCIVDGSAAGTKAAVGDNWVITQTNIDGAVIGPVTSAANNLPVFSGSTGKVIADSGYAIGTSPVSNNSSVLIPTQSAVVAYAQPLDAELTALAAVVSGANTLPYFTGSGTASVTDLTSFGRSLIDDGDATTARATLGLGSAATANATAFQAADDTLSALAALTTSADALIYANGADSFTTTTLTSFARSLLDDTNQGSAQATLGVYSSTVIGDPTTDFVAAFNAALL